MKANDLPETKQPYLPDDRTRRISAVLGAIDDLVQQMSAGHTAAFLEIGITMPQAKMLYLVATDDGVRMSALASRLGVTLSTVSGLVDRLVDGGLVDRHDDPADRRQVVLAVTPQGARQLERFRDLNSRQMGDLLGTLGDADLATVSRAITILTRAAAQMPHPPGPPGVAGPTSAIVRPISPPADRPAIDSGGASTSVSHQAERDHS